ncbi:MAG TPA: Asp-tRNA(Asn)/Glu-tRNA(Gln) amidotransferase subunit GatA [Candidatus Avalokitesvara rifleensis]|uniref:Asp-tRNA(Asn)/Glu-tRNA(Gln) amidotransferase subunit GatA n=1 Tax=Candidatus Avalokitesvara rifleensis TaxID=3367620 RepID=UPI0027139A31|nr:Asp-tRNA(Asn)/Glu-tRNA(Gln) amidotransferase subunit GatA [Candidatus Brocadiales bacterium]
MDTSTICELTAFELREKTLSGKLTAKKVVEELFAQIEEKEPLIGAYLTLDKEGALKTAEEIDARVKRGERPGLLTGVPVAVKDNICTRGLRTTCASKILGNFVPPYDAHVVERLRAEGAIIVGKTNLDEFAMGSSTENSGFKPTKNPWDVRCIPGGSSGGSAAAVAAGMAYVALGSDTGGSVRQPACLCGVVGLKPTYGRVSRYGLVAFGSSLDQIGPIAKDVRDAAILLQVIAGHDRRDSTCAAAPAPDYLSTLDDPIAGVRIGVPKEYFAEGLNKEVHQAVEGAIRTYKGLGANVVEISLPHTMYAVAVYYIIATAEASSNLARYDGVRYGYRTTSSDGLISMYSRSRAEGFGSEVKRRIMLGTYALSSGYYDAYYLKASKVRNLIRQDFLSAFEKVDVVLCPTSPTPAFRLGERIENPLEMYLSDVFTIPANLAGIPGISIPCGFTRDNLPIGMQIMGKHFDEATLLKVARAFERETDYHLKRPGDYP